MRIHTRNHTYWTRPSRRVIEVLGMMGEAPSPRAGARWRIAVGGCAVLAAAVLAVAASVSKVGHAAQYGLLEMPDGFGGGQTMLTEHYDKELRQRASAYWSAIAEQTDLAKGLKKAGVRGVEPADVTIPLSARDYPDPSAAFYPAKRAHQAAWDVIHKIRSHPIHVYSDLDRGFRAIDEAQREWTHHKYTLQELDSRIKAQYAALEKMYGQETQLAYRHSLITGELHRLMREADKISGEMLSIKGRYSQEINDLRDDYTADSREVKEAIATAEKELKENKEAITVLREKVREAAIKAAKFSEEAQHSMEDVEVERTRTRENEEDWKDGKQGERSAFERKIKYQADEANSMALEREETVHAGSVREIARMSSARHKMMDRRMAMTIKSDALAEVEKELQREAVRAKAEAEAKGEKTEANMVEVKARIAELEGQILVEKQQAADAKVNATYYTDMSRTAKKVFEQVTHKENVLHARIDEAQKTSRVSRAKRTQANMENRLSVVAAEGAEAMAEHDKGEANKAQAMVQGRLDADELQLKYLQRNISRVVRQTVTVVQDMYTASKDAVLYGGEARNQDELSDTRLLNAQEKEERADKLLKSVDALAAMAKTASEMATADHIREHAEEVAGLAGESSGVGPKAPINVVIETPAKEPEAEPEPEPEVEEEKPEVAESDGGSLKGFPIPGLGYLVHEDPGTKKFQDAGINV